MTQRLPTRRSLDGTGNNIRNPYWGASGTRFARRASVEYYDGANSPSGADRPGARVVSNQVCRQKGSQVNELGLTDLVWLWGQFLNHTLNLIPPAEPPEDYPIKVPTDDEAFPPDSLIPVARSAFDISSGTDPGNPREQVNGLTSFIDASSIYGADESRAQALRIVQQLGPVATHGARLSTSDGPDGPLLPMNEAGLNNQIVGPSAAYFLAGDERANTGFGLMAIHTLFVREHNRVVDQYVSQHPSSSPEDVYQFARRWTGALIQSVTYGEFVPAILGSDAIGPYEGYDPQTDATVSTEFVTFGFRFGHSMLSPILRVVDNSGQLLEDVPHGNALLNIGVVQRHGIGPILKGFASQAMQEIDVFVIDAMRSILFPGAPPIDLVALDLQRARDHGVPGYNRCRICFGLEPMQKFADVSPSPEVQQRLECTYASVDSIDPLIGGLAESHVAGSAFGELLRTVMIEQFLRLRAGDRFWYENDPAFSATELAELRQTRLSDVIRRNTGIENIQDDVFHISYGARA